MLDNPGEVVKKFYFLGNSNTISITINYMPFCYLIQSKND